MTAENRAALKALFETGDTLLQTSFEDLIDSFINLVETSAQTVNSPIIVQGNISCSSLSTTNVTADNIYINNIRAQGSAITIRSPLLFSDIVSSAAAIGTTRTSAYIVTAPITIIKSAVAGVNDGIVAQSGNSIQHIINDTATTVKVYSQVSGNFIDNTSVVQLFPNKRMTIFSVSPFSIGVQNYQYTMIGDKASV